MSSTLESAARRRRNAKAAAALRSRRYACGLRVVDLAAALDVSASAVYQWERGGARPTPETYARLLKVLRLPEGSLWLADDDTEVPA